jgi:putative transposase
MFMTQFYDSVTEARPYSSLGKKTPDEVYIVMLPPVKLAA